MKFAGLIETYDEDAGEPVWMEFWLPDDVDARALGLNRVLLEDGDGED